MATGALDTVERRHRVRRRAPAATNGARHATALAIRPRTAHPLRGRQAPRSARWASSACRSWCGCRPTRTRSAPRRAWSRPSRREAARVHLYPDGGSTALREALGRRLGVRAGPDRRRQRRRRADRADRRWRPSSPATRSWCPRPSFEPYTTVAPAGRRARASRARWPATTPTSTTCARRVTPRTKAVILCSPHNPATTIVRRGPLVALLDALGDDPPLVVLDEAYRDFCDDPEYPDGVALLRALPAAARPAHVLEDRRAGRPARRLRGRQRRVDRPAQPRARALQREPARPGGRARRARRSRAPRARRAGSCSRSARSSSRELAPARVHLPALAGELPPGEGARRHRRARAAARAAGLVVRDGAAVGFPDHLRISIGTRAANERLLRALDAA